MIFGRLLCTTAVPKHEFWEAAAAPPPFFFRLPLFRRVCGEGGWALSLGADGALNPLMRLNSGTCGAVVPFALAKERATTRRVLTWKGRSPTDARVEGGPEARLLPRCGVVRGRPESFECP